MYSAIIGNSNTDDNCTTLLTWWKIYIYLSAMISIALIFLWWNDQKKWLKFIMNLLQVFWKCDQICLTKNLYTVTWITSGNSDLPICTHFSYSVHILTLKYACTHCCAPGMHFAASHSSPVSVSMQVQIYEVDFATAPQQSAISGVKSFWPIRALHFNTLANLPLPAKCSARSIQFSASSTPSWPDNWSLFGRLLSLPMQTAFEKVKLRRWVNPTV